MSDDTRQDAPLPPDGRTLPAAALAAQAYYERGWWPIPLPVTGRKNPDGTPANSDGKNPAQKGWEKLRLEGDDILRHFGAATNVGLLLGAESGHLVDVDLDCMEAVRAVAVNVGDYSLLPPTPMRHGRKSVPAAHYWYKCALAKMEKFQDPEDGKVLVEVRYGSGARGLQTVVPPSLHVATGETLYWLDRAGRPITSGVLDALPLLQPAAVEAARLLASARRVAAVACLARALPPEGLHEVGMSVVGLLLAGGVKGDDCKRLIQILLYAAGKDNRRDEWLRTLEDSARRLQAGQPLRGGKTLAEFIGDKRVNKLREWLGLSGGGGMLDDAAPAGGRSSTHSAGAAGEKSSKGSVGLNPVPQLLGLEMELHDTGNAARFAQRYKGWALYCAALAGWFVWEKGKSSAWRKDETNLTLLRGVRISKELEQEAEKETDPDRQTLRRWWALTTQRSLTKIKAMLEIASAIPGLGATTDDFDQHPWRLALPGTDESTPGCTLDLTYPGLRALFGIVDDPDNGPTEDSARRSPAPPPDPQWRMTKLAGCALDLDAPSPVWERFLQRIFDGDAEMIGFMQRLAGYFLFGGNIEQRMAIFYGEGANGKGKFINALSFVLGEYAQTASKDALMAKENAGNNQLYALAALRGARFVAASETTEGKRLDEEVVKALTGEDPIPARYSHQNFFTYLPQFTPVLATNHKPRITGLNEGVWRRLLLIPFTVTIPAEERDDELGAKLEAEAPGILTWMLRGLLWWHRNRLETGRGLHAPQKVIAATLEYREESDPLGNFIEDCCQFGEWETVPVGNLHRAYKAYAEVNGLFPMYINKFSPRIAALEGVSKGQAHALGRVWKGIGLKAEALEAYAEQIAPPRPGDQRGRGGGGG